MHDDYMKGLFGTIGFIAGIALGAVIGNTFAGIILVIGFTALGFFIGGRIEDNINQREAERRAREEKERMHNIQMQHDPLYRAAFEMGPEYVKKLEEKRKIANEKYMREQQERKLAEQKRRAEEQRRKAEEEERKKETERRKSLKAKFSYTSISGYKAAYRYDYYPVNRYPYGTISQSNESARRSVWNFKDGSSSVGVNVIVDFLEGNYTDEQMKSLVLCVIPASTDIKNRIRYKSMCEQVCSKLPVQNGFGLISVCYDRADSRTAGKSDDTVSNLTFSSTVRGKDIILFDDITTRGTSFRQAADELMRRGARSVCGLFLGKTVSD